MPRTPRRPHRSPIRRRGLAVSAAWSHRWGTLAWVAAAAGFLSYFGIAYRAQIVTYPGGPAAFGLAATPVAAAMRPLSGVADRLDTYGGYVTYHNAAIAAFLLSLWALIQGAGAVRGWEERGGMAVWLASGVRRSRVVLDQWVGMLLALFAVAAGVGAGLGIGASVAEAPNWVGSVVVAVETSLVAATFFGIAVFISQFTRTARGGAGLTAMLMVALYLVANMSSELGWFAWTRYLSPFFYLQQSRVLIPGHSFDLIATAVLVATSTVPIVAAALAFERRDVGAALMPRMRAVDEGTHHRVAIRSFWRRDGWLADVRSQWIALTLWTLGSAGLMFLITSAAKQVIEIWQSSELVRQLFFRVPGGTFADQYMTYVTIVAALAPAAFVVAESARWVSDLSEGRVETALSATGSRVRVVLEWGMTTTVGMVLVVGAVVVGALAGAAAAGVSLRVDSLVRTGADGVLLAAGIAGVALLAVVVFRSGIAVGVLGAVLGVGFFVSLLAPMLKWPEWIVQLSPFDAFGTPYSSVPRPSGIALLAALALLGGLVASVVAQRRSSLS